MAFSSIYLTVILLFTLCLIYLTGTIFPQNVSIDDYIKAGGKFLFFAKYFSALDIFNSWFMIVIVSILCLNLMLCTIKRINKQIEFTKLFSVIYHLLFLLIILMLFVSNRVSLENEIQIQEGDAKEIELKTGEKIKVYLNRFLISYTEVPDYIKQKGFLNRLKVLFSNEGAHKIIDAEELKKSYREFTADVKVSYNGREYKHLLRVNNALAFSSYSLNLFSFEHAIMLKINGITYSVRAGEEFSDGGAEEYKVSEVFSGDLSRPDGSESVLEPEVIIYKKAEHNTWDKMGKLLKGKAININGVNFEFVDYNQYVVSGIKYDPTIKYLKFLSFLSIFLMVPVIINKMRGKSE
jgi:hypothetical protein